MFPPKRYALIFAATLVFGCASSGKTLTAGEGISFSDVRECAQFVGDFAEVLPIVNYAYLGAQKLGLAPDEEKEFRERIEAQNKQILEGIANLNQGLQKVEVSLDAIQNELAALRQEVVSIPDRTLSSVLYVDAYTLLKRISRLKDTSKVELEELRSELESLIDNAEAASSLSAADLRFFSACSLACIATRKCYDAELLLARGTRVDPDTVEYFSRTVKSLESLLAHSENTFDLLAKRRELTAEYDASVKRLVSKSGALGFSWTEDRSTCRVAIRSTKKPKDKGLRIILFRTERKPTPKPVITQIAFNPTASLSESMMGTVDPKKTLVLVFKPLTIEDFSPMSPEKMKQAAKTLKFVDVDASVGTQKQLMKAVEVYNESAEECRRIAFQVTLADGLAKWLADSKEITGQMQATGEKSQPTPN